ncbi:MAG: HlyD family secretion protein [Planctomycetaceae bacterium]|nr:HlyD family secretion protein [Planctomycetaceae bacterium]
MKANAGAALRLAAAAGRSRSRSALMFHMLNRTPLAAGCDRMALWRRSGCLRLLGVSGMDNAPDAAYASAWRKAAVRGGWGESVVRIPGNGGAEALAILREVVPGLSALWLPLPGSDIVMTVERWRGGFSDDEVSTLSLLAENYGIAWRAVKSSFSVPKVRKLVLYGIFAVAIAALMFFVRLPLRIVAPCEVVPVSPFMVATPMDGVISAVVVEPGQTVLQGEMLAVYEGRMVEGELEVSRRQVETVEIELSALQTRALENPNLRGDVLVLEARLGQERAKLALAELRWSNLRITAGSDGMVRMEDPSAWRGRPVAMGERMMWLVQADRNRVRIWLPQNDRVDFAFDKPVSVHLDALGGSSLPARLTRLGTLAQTSPEFGSSFPADAEWAGEVGDAERLLGLSGIAVLYGPEVRLGYWLVRKPLAGVRKWLGI